MTSDSIMKTVENLGCPTILLLGDFMLDRYITGDIERISSEAPVPIMKVLGQRSVPGGAGSVAANIRALGGRVMCAGIVGDDDAGAELCRKLSLTGANIDHLITLPGRPTALKERYIGLAQHRHGQQLLRVDRESSAALPESIVDGVLSIAEELLSQVDAVCLEDYDKGLLSGRLCQAMIELAKKGGKKVLVDPARISDYSKYAGADLICPNHVEAGLAAGCVIKDERSAAESARKLAEQSDFSAVVITMNKEGAYLLEKKGEGRMIGTRGREIYDVAGAGDAVLAALAVAVASGCDTSRAVALANAAGGLVVEKPGTATVSRQEILADLLAQRTAFTGKVCTADRVAEELKQYRTIGQSIVFTNGCLVVLHTGHVSLLAQARTKGDVLVVGLNSDESIRTNKGPDRPVCTEQQRASVLAALESVDYVVIFNETEPIELLKEFRPDILVKGEDCIQRGVVGRELVEGYGGRVEMVPMVSGCSTTNIIKTILQKYSGQS